MVSCLRRISGLTSIVTWPPSPTKHTVPHAAAQRTAADRPAAAPEVSSEHDTPRPPVNAWMAATGSPPPATIVCVAPNAVARVALAALVSTAITRAPIAAASCVADSPTGPWPKIAMVSRADRFMRASAP